MTRKRHYLHEQIAVVGELSALRQLISEGRFNRVEVTLSRCRLILCFIDRAL